MPRRARSFEKRTPEPDPKFSSVKYAKFINYLMERGKKSVSQRIFYTALDLVEEKMKKEKDAEVTDPRQVFDIALKNVSPIMEIKGRRIGGSNYQVPMEVQEPRRTALGMKWMIAAARARKGAPMATKLAQEVVDAFNKLGAAVKKREDTHRMAEANKAFAHFARFGSKRK
ncbi:30S ribosomal protein S7 [bacterium]|nr:MAG: 30S ribosomal protein S7 [bacterium]